ncbi:mRNA cleavage and polyadenylation factor subunit [Thecaphora frezii]
MTSASHSQQLPPSGASHAVWLSLSSPAPARSASARAAEPSSWYAHRGQPLCQLVTARDDVLRLYDARSVAANVGAVAGDGEVVRLHLLREHRVFGNVTGLCSVSTIASEQDGRDRLLVSFKDAKVALLEWSDWAGDLETVSIHTYERAPQLSAGLPSNFNQIFSVDPSSRCAALLLPEDSLAVLPFYQDMSDLEFYDIDQNPADGFANQVESLPYSPSFILPFREVDAQIKNVKDFCFLPGFQKPTVAVLFEQPQTWTGRLASAKDTCSVYLFTLDLTASIAGQEEVGGGLDGDVALQTVHPVLTTSRGLPYDCLYLVSCPPGLGGVLVISASSIVHIDQSGRVVVTAINDWFPQISSATPAESTCKVEGVHDLHSSQLVFTGPTEGILTLRDGTFCRFWCLMDGRSVGGVRLERITAASERAGETAVPVQASAPSVSLLLPGDQTYLLNASMVGDTTLFRCTKSKELLEDDASDAKEENLPQDDMDLDDDLYGDSAQNGPKAGSSSKSSYKEVLQLSEVDRISAYGPIADFVARTVTAKTENGPASRKQIIACTGSGVGAGLTYFEPDLTPRKKRRLDTRSSDRIWRVTADGDDPRRVTLLCSAEHEDVSELVFLKPNGSVAEVRDISGRSLAAGPLVGPRKRWARISTSGLHVIGPDADALQTIAVVQAEVVSGNIEEGEYATLQLSDGSFSLYKYDEEADQFNTLTLPAGLVEKQGASVNVFRDRYRQLSTLAQVRPGPPVPDAAARTVNGAKAKSADAVKKPALDDEDDIDYCDDDMGGDDANLDTTTGGATTFSHAPDAEAPSSRSEEPAPAYLFVMDPEGTCEIYSLPQLKLRWRCLGLSALPDRMDLELDRTYRLTAEQTVQIAEARVCYLDDVLHLIAVTDTNLLLAYEANPHHDKVEHRSNDAALDGGLLLLGFNKVFARALNASSQPRRGRQEHVNGDGYARKAGLTLRPFGWQSEAQDAVAVLSGGNISSTSWLYSTPKGGIRLVDCDPSAALGDLCWLGLEGGEVAICSEGSVSISTFDRSRNYDSDWNYQTFRTGRSYTKVVSHDATDCIVAASINRQPFVLYDEENEPVSDPAHDKTPTYSERGALELFTDDDKLEPIHGWEFDANETVASLATVTLDSPSVPGGRKKFIAVGTVVFYGEDRASKGSTYLFDIVEVVTAPSDPSNRFKLKLLCRDDSKAPVTALADINGFLISTSGQKLYVRALEKEEWLISVAFLDLAFYVTSIRVVKNFILLSDIKKSIWFVGFQEDPYKFVILGKDHTDQYATTGNFLINKDRLSLVSTSAAGGGALGGKEGVIRMFEYAPMVPSSLGGQRLLLKSEFQSAAPEAVASYTLKGRWLSRYERRGAESMRSKIVYAMSNGSIETLSAVDEHVTKRLQLLQGQLVRSVRHFAALNPRGFRAVRNDSVSRPLVKGISDGRLASVFASLPRPKMLEAVGTLSGLFNGFDEEDDEDEADADAAATAGVEGEDDEEVERKRLQRDEAKRRKREAKRADLILADLVRLRVGFEDM